MLQSVQTRKSFEDINGKRLNFRIVRQIPAKMKNLRIWETRNRFRRSSKILLTKTEILLTKTEDLLAVGKHFPEVVRKNYLLMTWNEKSARCAVYFTRSSVKFQPTILPSWVWPQKCFPRFSRSGYCWYHYSKAKIQNMIKMPFD